MSAIPTQDTAPVQTSFRWVAACTDWRLGLKQSSFHHIPRVPRHPAPVRLGTATAFLACSGPLHLSDPGKPSDPGTSLRVPPSCAGDTTRRLAAHAPVGRWRGACGQVLFQRPPARTRRARFPGNGLSSDHLASAVAPAMTPSTVSAFRITRTSRSLRCQSPGPLRPASGSPGLPGRSLLLRLLRGLRRHRTRVP